MKTYANTRSTEGRFLRSLIDEGLLPEDLMICVGGAGALPYYSDLPTIVRRGLNDIYIARIPLKQHGKIGHERHVPYKYLAERRVVMVDILNRIVYDFDRAKRLPEYVRFAGTDIADCSTKAKNRYLIFRKP